jgi:hypothetical protein
MIGGEIRFTAVFNFWCSEPVVSGTASILAR